MIRILSKGLYEFFTTMNQTRPAATGTAMYLLTPKSPIPAATPANSLMILPKSARPRTNIVKKVARRPNSSRMRSDSPLPVTAPIRAAISCTTMRATVVGISVQSSPYPNLAPACEYVRMPPGSLSTLAVMNPGPITAANANSWNRIVRRDVRRSFWVMRMPYPFPVERDDDVRTRIDGGKVGEAERRSVRHQHQHDCSQRL